MNKYHIAENYLFCQSPDLFIRETFTEVANQEISSDDGMSIRKHSNSDNKEFLLFFSKGSLVYIFADPFEIVNFQEYCDMKINSGTAPETYMAGAQYLIAEHILFRVLSSLDRNDIWDLLPSIIILLKLGGCFPRDFSMELTENSFPEGFTGSNYCLYSGCKLRQRGFFTANDKLRLNQVKKEFVTSSLALQLEAIFNLSFSNMRTLEKIPKIPLNSEVLNLIDLLRNFCRKAIDYKGEARESICLPETLQTNLQKYIKNNLIQLQEVNADGDIDLPISLRPRAITINDKEVSIDLEEFYNRVSKSAIKLKWLTIVFNEELIKQYVSRII